MKYLYKVVQSNKRCQQAKSMGEKLEKLIKKQWDKDRRFIDISRYGWGNILRQYEDVLQNAINYFADK